MIKKTFIGTRKAYLDPIYCIAAQVPAISAPGLKLLFATRPNDYEITNLEPDRLGLPYTPPRT